MRSRKSLYTLTIFIICLGFLGFLSIRTESRTRIAMGTFVAIRLTGFAWDDFNSAFTNAFEAIESIEKTANIHDSKSELSTLNKSAYKIPFRPSEDLFYIIYISNSLYKETDGAFDVTAAPLTMLWKTGIKNKSVPNKRDIKQAFSLVGSDKIVLDNESRTVRFKNKGMSIDLSALAKGYAVDKAALEIKKSGFKSAMINAGGDISCIGSRNFIFPWRVGIRDPNNKEEIFKVISISGKAVATSGGYEQWFVSKGRYYTHIIDPKTGYPVDNFFNSVTVIADNCLMADAIATAVYVGGEPVRKKLQAIYPDVEIIALK
jgi:FAD:protein FMN transferase